MSRFDRFAWHPAVATVMGLYLIRSPFVKEFTLRTPRSAEEICVELGAEGILPGLPLSRWYADRPNELLVAVTEKKTREEIDALADALGRVAGGGR